MKNGLTIRYVKTGTGPNLLLLHTLRTQLDYFQRLIPLLRNQFTVYAIDLPGHGYSSINTTAKYDEPYMRAAVVAFVEGLDLKDVTIAGESIGGVLALTVASELPDRVKAVISSNPYDYDRRYADGVRRGNLFANLVIGTYQVPVLGAINAALENRLFLGWVLKGGFYDNSKLPRDLLAEFDRVGRRRGYRAVERKTFAGWRSWRAARQLYKQVRAPVTLVYGDHDWSSQEERQQNITNLPAAQMITLEKTGHFSGLERPHETADIIVAYRT